MPSDSFTDPHGCFTCDQNPCVCQKTDEEQAVRFLATLRELDPPNFVHVLGAVLILRDSDNVEALRLAGKAILRNLQRLEDALDEAKSKASS